MKSAQMHFWVLQGGILDDEDDNSHNDPNILEESMIQICPCR